MNLVCGKTAVGGNHNSMRDKNGGSMKQQSTKDNHSTYISHVHTEECSDIFLKKVLLVAQSHNRDIISNIPHVMICVASQNLIYDFCERYASIIADYDILPQKSDQKLAYLKLFYGIEKNELKMELQKIYDLERYKNRYYGTLCIMAEDESFFQEGAMASLLKEFVCENSDNMKFIFAYKKNKQQEQILELLAKDIWIREVKLNDEEATDYYTAIFTEILQKKDIVLKQETIGVIHDYYKIFHIKERYSKDTEGVQRLANDFYYFLYTEGIEKERITGECLETFLQFVGTKNDNVGSKLGFY